VKWGIDFVKLDLCRHASDPCSACEKNELGWSENLIFDTYIKWSRLLYHCGRDILYSASTYNFRDWNPEYCNMSRTTDDIRCRVFELRFKDIDFSDEVKVRDIYLHEDLGYFKNSITKQIDPHSSCFFILSN